MHTRVDEIADGIYRLSTLVPDLTPAGFTFNQFLVTADEPLLFHTGPRAMFPLVSEAVGRVLPVERLRWVAFGHVEADENGSMNQWLAAAPHAEVAHNVIGCLVQLNDLADRPPRALADGEVLDLGGKRLRNLDTPHVPHGWEAHVFYEETTGTLLAGDLFTHMGGAEPFTEGDVVAPAMEAEDVFGATCLTPATGPTIRRLAELAPTTVAVMHGSSFAGDTAGALNALADAYEGRLAAAVGAAAG